MSEKKSVYIVSSGEYSDYHIVAIYETEALAKEHSQYVAESRIEEWELNTVKPKFYWHSVHIRLGDGAVTNHAVYREPTTVQRRGVATHLSPPLVYAHGATLEEAIKNAADYRRAYLAGEVKE
jgi:hypothetical protein